MIPRKSCPYCGHRSILEIECYDSYRNVEIPTPKSVLLGRVPILIRSVCRNCGLISQGDTPKRCGKEGHEAKIEYQYFFDGVSSEIPERDDEPWEERMYDIFWKCKRCLRTWSRIFKSGDVTICPRCGMKSGVKMSYGLATSDLGDAQERGEIRLGGCCIARGMPDWWCIECGHSWGERIFRHFDDEPR